MSTAADAKLQYESGQTSYAMEALTNSGDNKIFTSQAVLFSGANGKKPDVKPDGLATGGVVTSAVSAANDAVDVAALTCYLAGVKASVAAAIDQAITRPVANVASIHSVTVTSAGAIAIIAGADSADSSFSETRGAAGGPPYIPVGSIEIGQVRLADNVAAPIAASEIFQAPGLHQERYNSPIWTVDSKNAQVIMDSALSTIHTGDTTKAVNASYADPLFSDVPKSENYVPSETSHSVNSTPIYGSTLGSTSKTLNQGSFTAYLENGIRDPLIKSKDDTLWFRFYPNRYEGDYMLDQGILGISRTYPAGDEIAAACTISASEAAVGVEA